MKKYLHSLFVLSLLAFTSLAFAQSRAVIHEETFDTDLGTWMEYSVEGEQVWEWADYGQPAGCARVSGYDGGALDNEDWLISPALNLDNYENEVLTFISAANYSGPAAELKVSTDYDGSGDPSANGTWTDLTDQAAWSGGSWEWIESGDVDISAFDGTAVYIAFVYYSNPDDGAMTWEVDNILVEEASTTPILEVTSPNGGEMWEQGSTHNITWESENFAGDVKIELTGTNASVIVASTGNTGTYAWTIPADQAVASDYKVKISDAMDGDPMDDSDATFSIIAPPSYVLEETFDADLGVFTGFSVTGDQVWEWEEQYGNPPGCAVMSGYEGEQFENEDWLISPAMDLSAYSTLVLAFDEAINYEDGNVNDNEKIYISTDYTGSGDPNANGTWTELTVTGRSDGGSWDFVSVDEVDISAYAGETEVYLAFKYLSTTDNAATWELDNIVIEEPNTQPMLQVTSPNGGEMWEQGNTYDITWTSENFNGEVKIELTGSNASVIVASVDNTGSYSWAIPAGQPVADDYKVKISDAADGDPMDESDAAFSIVAAANYIHQETFDTDLGTWTEYSVTGEQMWEWADFGDPAGCAKMSGYAGEPLDNEDWLISPALNLDQYVDEILTFISASNYDGPDLALFYSTDYDGSSDPSTQGTWNEITDQAQWSDGNWNWVESGNIDLTAIEGTAVYLAFVYYSNPDEGAKTWEIDNIEITGNDDVGLIEIDEQATIYATDNMVWVNAPFSGKITVYNLMGQEVATSHNYGEELTGISMGENNGFYIVRWTDGKHIATKKVLVD